MKIIGYLKTKPKWGFILDERGEEVKANYYSDTAQVKVPVFEISLRYQTYYQGRSMVAMIFKSRPFDNGDAVIGELTGEKFPTFRATLNEGLNIMDLVARQEFEILGDGWFKGTFTFSKRGSTITILPIGGQEYEIVLPDSE